MFRLLSEGFGNLMHRAGASNPDAVGDAKWEE